MRTRSVTFVPIMARSLPRKLARVAACHVDEDVPEARAIASDRCGERAHRRSGEHLASDRRRRASLALVEEDVGERVAALLGRCTLVVAEHAVVVGVAP